LQGAPEFGEASSFFMTMQPYKGCGFERLNDDQSLANTGSCVCQAFYSSRMMFHENYIPVATQVHCNVSVAIAASYRGSGAAAPLTWSRLPVRS
jgi:hypothetical protein